MGGIRSPNESLGPEKELKQIATICNQDTSVCSGKFKAALVNRNYLFVKSSFPCIRYYTTHFTLH